MEYEILKFLERVAEISEWDREPAIYDKDLNDMINFLKGELE